MSEGTANADAVVNVADAIEVTREYIDELNAQHEREIAKLRAQVQTDERPRDRCVVWL